MLRLLNNEFSYTPWPAFLPLYFNPMYKHSFRNLIIPIRSHLPLLPNQIPYHLVHPLNRLFFLPILLLQSFNFLIQFFNYRQQISYNLPDIIFPGTVSRAVIPKNNRIAGAPTKAHRAWCNPGPWTPATAYPKASFPPYISGRWHSYSSNEMRKNRTSDNSKQTTLSWFFPLEV